MKLVCMHIDNLCPFEFVYKYFPLNIHLTQSASMNAHIVFSPRIRYTSECVREM